jgi:hypothetical protein
MSLLVKIFFGEFPFRLRREGHFPLEDVNV